MILARPPGADGLIDGLARQLGILGGWLQPQDADVAGGAAADVALVTSGDVGVDKMILHGRFFKVW